MEYLFELLMVALRKESVDRNFPPHNQQFVDNVALRKESVDRNVVGIRDICAQCKSLSARRAWIETRSDYHTGGRTACRSPQGERG